MSSFYFPTWINKFVLMAGGGGGAVTGYLAICLYVAVHPTTVNVGYAPEQPVPYSHQLHVGELGLDCRYCHNTVDQAAHAAIPPTETCGNCHGGFRYEPDPSDPEAPLRKVDYSAVHLESEWLGPVRESLESGEPIKWMRVHNMPDFVYFNHSAHVNRGVSCVACHGRVDRMEIVTQVKSLSMKFCLDCHRNPAPHLRPLDQVTNLGWTPPEGKTAEEVGFEIMEQLDINPNTNCSTCHR